MPKVQPVSLLAVDPATKEVVDSLAIDAVVNEMHTLNATITDHPVEEGVNVSDHARPEPDQLQLECYVSNTPLSRAQRVRAIQAQGIVSQGVVLNLTTMAGDVQTAVGAGVQGTRGTVQTTAASASVLGEVEGRAKAAFAQLKDWRDQGQLLTVVTTLRSYESMGIVSFSVPRDSKTSDALHFSLTLKYVRVVQSRLTRSRVAKDPRARRKVDKGTATPKDTTSDNSAFYNAAHGGVQRAAQSVGDAVKGAFGL